MPVQDAEKYRSEDEVARRKIEAKNGVENYAYVPHACMPVSAMAVLVGTSESVPRVVYVHPMLSMALITSFHLGP